MPANFPDLGIKKLQWSWREAQCSFHSRIQSFIEKVTRTTDSSNIPIPVAQLCPTPRDPVDCSLPGSSVLHYWSLLKSTATESVMLSDHLMPRSPFSLCLQSPLASGSFPMSWLFASGVSIHQHKIKCNLSSPWQLCLYNYKINSTCLVLDILLMAWRGLDEWWSSYVHNY